MQQALTSTKRLAKNTIMMYIRMGITMIVGLISTRIVLQALGEDDFGLYNAVSGIVVLITFLNNAMMLATQRYLSYAIGEGSSTKLQDVFNASVYIYLAIVILIVLIGETVGLWFLNQKMVFADDKIVLANFVYQFSLLITCFNVIRTPFNSLFVSIERMDFYALTSVVESCVNLCFVLLLLLFSSKASFLYIVLQTLAAFLILIWVWAYFKKSFSTQIKFAKVEDKKLFKDLFSFSSWGMFGSLAVVGFQQGINILLNMFFGVTVNAAFGIANKVNSLVNQFFTGFQTAANPQITKAYASGDISAQVMLINRTTKISFFLLLLVGTVVIYNTDFLLLIWLSEVPNYTVELARLMIIGAMIDALSSPLYVTIYATGRIKVYQLVISFILLLNIFVSYILFKEGYGLLSCMYVRILIFSIAYIIRLFFVKAYTQIEISKILHDAILPIMIMSGIVFVLLYFSWGFQNSYIRLLIITPVHASLILILMYYIGFNKKERIALIDIASKLKNKLFHK